jgi:recombination protein RecR
MNNADPLEHLIAALARLPGVGRRSAQRMAVRIAREPGKLGDELAAALQMVKECVRSCSGCGHLTSVDRNPCSLCTDPRRDSRVLCVVEDPGDILVIEASGAFRGRYHALMGKLSAMKGQGRAQLRLEALLNRIDQDGIGEIILALNTDVESDATAEYIRQILASRPVQVSRLAYGIPAGSGVAYADPVTLSRALQGRVTLK